MRYKGITPYQTPNLTPSSAIHTQPPTNNPQKTEDINERERCGGLKPTSAISPSCDLGQHQEYIEQTGWRYELSDELGHVS